jgi:natural resistance-associated macrophage protein
VLLTRSIAILPTLFLSLSADLAQLTSLNDSLNALMSLQLPFALLPTLTFSSSERVMGSFKNGFANKLIATSLSFVVIAINLYFVYSFAFVEKNIPINIWTSILILIFVIYYIIFILYLLGCFLVVIGLESLTLLPFIGIYLKESEEQVHIISEPKKPSLIDSINNPNYRPTQEAIFNQISEEQ